MKGINYVINRVSFRDFEDRDVDFVYKTKQSSKVNISVIGDYSNFTYEDAVKWVEGCKDQNSNYRFWAICTNDSFQNIIGWCSICNIDHNNKKVAFHGVTIADPKYRDGVAWYETYYFILDYVFNVLNFNRLYSMSLTTNKSTNTFNMLFFNSEEGILKQAIYRRGQYHDMVIHAIIKEEFEKYMSEGLFDFDVYMSKFKQLFSQNVKTMIGEDDFVGIFRKELQSTNPDRVNSETKFRELDEWSSMYAIDIAAQIESGYKVSLTVQDFDECETIHDLYNLTFSKVTEKKIEDLETVEYIENVTETYIN